MGKQRPAWDTQEQVRDIIIGYGDCVAKGHSELDKAAWLAARMHGIGASEIAILLGLKKNMKFADTPRDLLKLKTGQAIKADLSKKPKVRFGQLAEDDLLQMVREFKNRPCVGCGWLFQSLDFPYLLATPDGLQWHPKKGLGLLELKCCWSSGAYDWGNGEWGPPYYISQVQQQILVTGISWGSLAGMVDGKFVCFDYDVDAKQHDDIIVAGEKFWEKVEKELAKAA
jgi:putative phage-type endonuclease